MFDFSFAGSPAQSPHAVARQMAELCIRYNGRTYGYRGYRYERLADAVAYARLERERGFRDPSGESAAMAPIALPTDVELGLMHALAIEFRDGVFHWREFRYDRLADALAYISITR
jgi:hypothetical protein